MDYARRRGLSERRACRLIDVARSTARYTAQPDRDEALVAQLKRIKAQNPRFGIRRAHALLNRALANATNPKVDQNTSDQETVDQSLADQTINRRNINRKRVERVWCKYALQVPQRRRKRKLKTGNKVPRQAQRPDHIWCYDFQEDALISGRKIRLLNVLDEFNREWLAVMVGASLTSHHVLATLQSLFATRGVPAFVRSDNGPEFIATDVQEGLRISGASPHFIDPGSPWQNGYQESFHGKLRDEFLNREAFVSIKEAQTRLDQHRRWYNQERPHSSLKYQTPIAYRQAWEQGQLEQAQSQSQETSASPE